MFLPDNDENLSVEEITISVPWGHISGKWWGRKDVRPILTLHGLQDNAGSFDRLIPLLPDHIGYLALDLPGHGHSSFIPAGQIYSTHVYLNIFYGIFQQFKWDKISLLCHSMSSMICFMYAACCPDKIDIFIAIDSLKPHIRPSAVFVQRITDRLKNNLIADQRNQCGSEPPSYTYDDLLDKYVAASQPSMNRECAEYIVCRGMKPSKTMDGHFYFSRDNRLKSLTEENLAQADGLEMASRMQMPYCFIRATVMLRPKQKPYQEEVIKVLRKCNPHFQVYDIVGDHYLHLTEPEKICDIISTFINKYRPSEKVKLDSKLYLTLSQSTVTN